MKYFYPLGLQLHYITLIMAKNGPCGLGVKVRNMKMDFNTGGTWRRVEAMNTNDEN